MLESIFRELILDHYRKPRNKGELDATVTVAMRNPLCGDEIELQLDIEDDVVHAARFTGRGCSISQASASMMAETLEGKSLDEAVGILSIPTPGNGSECHRSERESPARDVPSKETPGCGLGGHPACRCLLCACTCTYGR